MIEQYNNDRLMKHIKHIKRILLTVIITLLLSNAYFAYRWQRETFREITYFISPDATLPAYGKDQKNTKSRNLWEIENFSENLIGHMLAHTKENFDENINKAFRLLDRKSINRFLNIIESDNLEEMYKENDGNSKLTIKNITIDMSKYPFEIMVEFELEVNFIGREEKIKTTSNVYFHAETVKRSKPNPYGLIATHLYFLTPKDEKKE